MRRREFIALVGSAAAAWPLAARRSRRRRFRGWVTYRLVPLPRARRSGKGCVTDPVGSGFVASIPRPGGNVTGFITMAPTMPGKWVELLKDIAPRVNRVAMLFNPATATYAEYFLKPFKAAAPSLQ